ncbi:MAG TPA: APC family permease [Methanothrix sp.]|nr:APC family permease [Methanothrix sp.]
MQRTIQLRRTLGLFEVTISGIGIILGAGIYALIGQAAGLAGNAVWISFLLSAVVAVFTGLSYAELASMYPRASAEYEYTSQAFGRFPAFVIGWLIIFSGVIGAATVALGFAGYLRALTGAPLLPVALLLLAGLSAVVLLGIKQSARLAIAFTAIEASGLVLVVLIGLPYLGRVDYFEMSPLGLSGIFQASALIFFAFLGFEEMVKLSEEAKDPEKNIPKALILAISGSIVIYIMVALSAVSVLGWQALSRSPAPFADIAYSALGQEASVVLSVMALFATANTVLLMLVASSRIIYGMAGSGCLPRLLSAVHARRQTPWRASLLSMTLSMAFVFLGDIALVANVNNFTVFVTFIVINASLIWLRFKRPEAERPFRVPVTIGRLALLPLLGILLNAFMLAQLDRDVAAIGLALMASGALAALANRRWRARHGCKRSD